MPTEVAGVFANEFAGPKETVWTLYNANGRSVGKPALRVRHVKGARYEDAWNGKPLAPEIKDGYAVVALDLDPKGIGCLVQHRTLLLNGVNHPDARGMKLFAAHLMALFP